MSSTVSAAGLKYPAIRRDESVTETLHGRFQFADPYRYLEDVDAEETKAFVKAQQVVFGEHAATYSKDRSVIRARMEALYNYSRASCPMVRGKHAFVYANSGLQNQDVLYKLAAPAVGEAVKRVGEEEVQDVFAGQTPFMDLNAQFPDGTTALSSTSFSEDGSLFAYGLSRGGSDWVTIYVRDVVTGKDLPDNVPFVKFSGIKWTKDNAGFFYCRYPAPPEVKDTESGKAGTETTANQTAFVVYHRIGTSASEDVLVYACPAQPNWRFGVDLTDDGEYLIITTVKGTDPVNRLYYCHLPTHWSSWLATHAKPLSIPPGGIPPIQAAAAAGTDTSDGKSYVYLPLVRAIDNFEAEYDVIANDGARFYLRTNLHAPKYRIVVADFPPHAPVDTPVLVGAPRPAPGAVIDIDQPSSPTPPVYDAVPEHPTDVLDWAAAVAGTSLVLCYMRMVVNVLQVRTLPSTILPLPTSSEAASALLIKESSEVPLPAPGTIASFAGRRDQDTVFIKFVSFLHPGSILRISFADGAIGSTGPAAAGVGASSSSAVEVKKVILPGPKGAAASAQPIPLPLPGPGPGSSTPPLALISSFWETSLADFNPSDFEVKQVLVPSKDGKAKIPMFIVHRRGLLEERGSAGGAPTLQYGYGGFNISVAPQFSSLRLVWLRDCGGVYALANIRGGGELGEDWHQAGMRHQKQNCFDDFAACSEWLISNGYTSPKKLAIMGGSNGGLLTLATSLQRPELYAAAISQVPVADMMRFHKFTIGAAWRGEYGFAEDSPEDCEVMLKYSPLHNVKAPESKEQELPSILITTADHDDRVVPLHSFKMAAQLQAIAGASPHQTRPLLVRIESDAGHGAGKPTSKVLDEMADTWAFIAHETGATVKA